MSSLQPPLSAPIQGLVAGARGRSQSVSTHTNMTGLRISMAQSRPGNVLAPHMPALARAASSGSTLQANAYANGGYFASRRASVSNVGLAVDPSHSIRIPTIMFQKQKSDEQVYPSNTKVAVDGTAALITPKSAIEEKAVDDAEKTETKAQDSPAMRRLQEMIESMRKLSSGSVANEDSAAASVATTESTATTSAAALAVAASSASSSRTSSPLASLPSKGTDAASTGIEAPEASSIASMPAITLPPTPAAHPTSRFDSILEEDEDTEDDEAKLDADTGSSSGAVSNVEDDAPTTTATLATANASSANQPSASAVCAL
ncbi:hypothetical protein BX070DRAFT_219248 [Coemansia spiralis]|nr:hypothetical protein BX070DRAFT_219248 [Coemansia spiralis]